MQVLLIEAVKEVIATSNTPGGVCITISDNPGTDAKRYQERSAEMAICEVNNEGK